MKQYALGGLCKTLYVMRKFDLYDKVVIIKKGEENRNGCIVGFTTIEEDGCIVDKPSGISVEPEEHAYNVLIGEVEFDEEDASIQIEECFESDLQYKNDIDYEGTPENPFAGTNKAILDFMNKNRLEGMHIEMFVEQEYDKVCIYRDYYETLAETDETGDLKP
jgi:hypothetical protein